MIATDNLIQVLLIQAECTHTYTLPEFLSHTHPCSTHIEETDRSSAHTHAYRDRTYKPTYPLLLTKPPYSYMEHYRSYKYENIYKNLKKYPILQHLQPYNTNCYHTLRALYAGCSDNVQCDRVCRCQNIVRYNCIPICKVYFLSLLKKARAHTPPTNCIFGRLHNQNCAGEPECLLKSRI